MTVLKQASWSTCCCFRKQGTNAVSCADELSRFSGKHFIRQTQRLSRCQCLEPTVPGQPPATAAEPKQIAADVGLSVFGFGLVLSQSDYWNQDASQAGRVSKARAVPVLPVPPATYLRMTRIPFAQENVHILKLADPQNYFRSLWACTSCKL